MPLNFNHRALLWRRLHLFSAVLALSAFLVGYFLLRQDFSLSLVFFYGPAVFFMPSSLVFFHVGQSNFFNYPSLQNITYTLFRFACVGVTVFFVVLALIKKSPLIFPQDSFFALSRADLLLRLWSPSLLYLGLSVLSAFVVAVGAWKILMSFGLLSSHRAQNVALKAALILFGFFILFETLFFFWRTLAT